MEYVEGTALNGVSRICIGCEQLGGVDWGEVDIQEIEQALKHANSYGINFYDTAAIYGIGESEKRLGELFRGDKGGAVIATKGGLFPVRPNGNERAIIQCDASRQAIRGSVAQSKERLQICRLPIFYIHRPDEKVPIKETMETLVSLKGAGEIGAIGLSNFNIDQIREAMRYGDVDVVQVSFSILNSGNISVIEYCREQAIAVCVYGVLEHGLLSGKYSSESVFGRNDRRHRLRQFSSNEIKDNMKIVDKVRRLAKDKQKTLVQISIRFALQYPGVSSVIVGVKSKKQLEECTGVFDWKLEQCDLDYLANCS